MKFNEKLIELRKKEGLSQEELGYKLNVTRQTVSKWELGQTTPEMDKLVEMSKIFNISVDELVNDNETVEQNTIIEDKKIGNASSKEKIVKYIIIGVICIAIIYLVIVVFVGRFVGRFVGQKISTISKSNIIESTPDIVDEGTNWVSTTLDNFNNIYNNDISEDEDEIIKNSYNISFEMYQGSKIGSTLKIVLDKVITNNKKEDRKITVNYMGIETKDPDEIKDLKKTFDDSDKFEISYEYDENGYIYKVIIENL